MSRWLIALPSAACMTFVLFFAMQALIALREGEVQAAPSGKVVGFVRLKRDIAPPPLEQAMPERPPPLEAPPTTDMTPDAPAPGDVSGPTLDIAAPRVSTSVKMALGASVGTAVGDTDAVPLMRVEPRYPPAQLQDGVEGWVRVRFGIGKGGKTRDVGVIDSKPAVVFDEAAVNAVRKWKYQPRVVHGQQVQRHGLTVRLVFKVPEK